MPPICANCRPTTAWSATRYTLRWVTRRWRQSAHLHLAGWPCRGPVGASDGPLASGQPSFSPARPGQAQRGRSGSVPVPVPVTGRCHLSDMEPGTQPSSPARLGRRTRPKQTMQTNACHITTTLTPTLHKRQTSLPQHLAPRMHASRDTARNHGRRARAVQGLLEPRARRHAPASAGQPGDGPLRRSRS